MWFILTPTKSGMGAASQLSVTFYEKGYQSFALLLITLPLETTVIFLIGSKSSSKLR